MLGHIVRTFPRRGGGAVRAPMSPDAWTGERAEADLVAVDAAPTPEDPTEPSSTLVLDRGGPRRAWAMKQLEAGFEAKFPNIDWVRNDMPFD